MAAMHYSWLRGSYEGIEQMYIFHKLEIIRAVNTAISESAPLARVGIVEAVNALSFAEVLNEAAITRFSFKDLRIQFGGFDLDCADWRFFSGWSRRQHRITSAPGRATHYDRTSGSWRPAALSGLSANLTTSDVHVRPASRSSMSTPH